MRTPKAKWDAAVDLSINPASKWLDSPCGHAPEVALLPTGLRVQQFRLRGSFRGCVWWARLQHDVDGVSVD